MRLIVGLGNPGERYARTRHNLGARVLEKAAATWSVDLQPTPLARRGRGRIGEVEVTLVIPVAWMNEAGPVVKALLDDLVLSCDDLVVVHDDLDLEVGRLRIKRDGGTGGHNGILSIATALNTNQFPRVKLGIGRPAPGEDAADYVLSPFSPEELELVGPTVERAVQALECVVTHGIAVAMNRFNVRESEGERDEDG